jgi:hypothetical protein
MSREPTEIEMRVAAALARVALEDVLSSGELAGQGSSLELAIAALRAEKKLRDSYVGLARAAIRAMREPTEDMLDAGAIVEVDTGWGGRGSYKPVGDAYRETRWKQMIDAASPPEK